MNTITVVITDDHPMVVTGLEHVFQHHEHIRLTHTYSTGRDLLEGLKKEQPHILLLDMQLPDMPGKAIAQEVLSHYPDVKILILSGLEAPEYVEEMMTFGCSGYLLKSSTDHNQLIKAIETVYYGEQYLEESLRKELMGAIVRKKRKSRAAAELLTNKEKEILKLIVDGHSSRQIAALLQISARTVDTHRLSLGQKLEAKNAAELTKKAIELHLIK